MEQLNRWFTLRELWFLRRKIICKFKNGALGIIFSISSFHRFIHARHFTLQNDHKPLLTIFDSKKGLPIHWANRLQRWGTILLNYNFKMVNLLSNRLGHADGRSRLIPKYEEPLEDTVIASLQYGGELKITLCNSVREIAVTRDQTKEEDLCDEYINRIKTKILEKDQRSTNVVLLYKELVIPSTLHKRNLKIFHAGHPGSNRRKSLIRSFLYWSNMDKDIENAVKRCKDCVLAVKAPPGQRQTFHGVGYTLTSLARGKDFAISL